MKRFILIQVVLLSISGIGCGDAAMSTNTNTSASNANRESNTPSTNQTNTVRNNQTANVIATNSNAQLTNSQRTPQPTPSPQTAEKKDEGWFSFPPPRVVSYFDINRQQLMNQEGPTTLSSVAQKLEAGLKAAGYSEGKFTYYWNNDNEFAIITAMERINADATPFAGSMRWENSENLPKAHNLNEYVQYLFSGKKVYSRVFAFVVTNKKYNFFDNSPPSFNAAKNWMRIRKSELGGSGTSAIRQVAFDEQYQCSALLYLFVNHNSLDNPKPIDEGELKGNERVLMDGVSLDAVDHLHRTQINFGG